MSARLRRWGSTAGAVARRDLLIEWRSRVALNQVLPFAAMMMVLFAFVIDSDTIAKEIAPGLVWMTLVFAMVVLVERSYSAETEDGALEAVRASGVSPSALFWGKTVALTAQLLAVVSATIIVALFVYGVAVRPTAIVLLVVTALAAAAGLGCVGTLYGGLAAGARGRETLLPLLVLPVVAPVLIGATRAAQEVFDQQGSVASGWPWTGLVVLFTVVFAGGGTLAYGPLIDEEESP